LKLTSVRDGRLPDVFQTYPRGVEALKSDPRPPVLATFQTYPRGVEASWG